MIRVERIDCPKSLDPKDETAAGPLELSEMTERVARGEVIKSGDFKAYRRDDVRAALKEMFHGKCAYCECIVVSQTDGDVEHFRPKTGVSDAEKQQVEHPGYWWLAMVWENLVLSCTYCNQWRSAHEIIPHGLESEEELKEFLMNPPRSGAGKANSFPTEDNKWVLGPDDDLKREKPLLLNPVDVDPDEHLEWVMFKAAATVRPKDQSPVGEATCRILGLNRRQLAEHRRICLLEMREDRNNIIEDLNNWLEASDPADQARWEDRARRDIARLIWRTEADRPFAGMARAVLAHVQAEVEEMTQPPIC